MTISDFLCVVFYALSIPFFYKKGYRQGVVHGLDKILKEMDD